MKKKKVNKWDVIDRFRYSSPPGAREFEVIDFRPCMKVVEYRKNDVMLYYFRHGTILFMPANWDVGESYQVFKSVFKTIEKIAPKDKKIGFELCELSQLNIVVQYMLKRNGYKTKIENGFLIVE